MSSCSYTVCKHIHIRMFVKRDISNLKTLSRSGLYPSGGIWWSFLCKVGEDEGLQEVPREAAAQALVSSYFFWFSSVKKRCRSLKLHGPPRQKQPMLAPHGSHRWRYLRRLGDFRSICATLGMVRSHCPRQDQPKAELAPVPVTQLIHLQMSW